MENQDGAANTAGASTTESLAKQQIMAELTEAQKMLDEAITPEAASFWEEHVKEFESRLRALGEDPSASALSAGAEGSKSREASLSPEKAFGQKDDPDKKEKKPAAGKESGKQTQKKERVSPPSYDGPMIDVLSPADLPAGYTFEAQMGNKRFLATVPEGGVKKGEQFSCPMRELQIKIESPTGKWRDDMIDCFKNGVFHPLVLTTLFCPLLSVGQIMTRNRLSWMGSSTNESSITIMAINLAFWILMNFMAFCVLYVNWTAREQKPSGSDIAAVVIINLCMLMLTILFVSNTRRSIRDRYKIPEQRCVGKEDVVCATFCMPLTICQMGRHTADFETYEGQCCTDTGLPNNMELAPTSDQDGYQAPKDDAVV